MLLSEGAINESFVQGYFKRLGGIKVCAECQLDGV